MIPFTKEELAALLHYDSSTGALTWRVDVAQRVKAGMVAGSVHPLGYVMVQLRKHIYAAHRLVWKMQTGQEPDVIDHINGNRADNRIDNLRSVSRTVNLQHFRNVRKDSVAKLLGVCYRKDRGDYQSRIQKFGKTEHLGFYPTAEAAHAAYCAAKMKGEK